MMEAFTCGIIKSLILSKIMSSRDLVRFVDHIRLAMFISLSSLVILVYQNIG